MRPPPRSLLCTLPPPVCRPSAQSHVCAPLLFPAMRAILHIALLALALALGEPVVQVQVQVQAVWVPWRLHVPGSRSWRRYRLRAL